MILMEIIYTFLMVAVQFPVIMCVIGIAISGGTAFPFLAPCIMFAESLSLYQLQKLVKAGYFGLIALKYAVEHPDEIQPSWSLFFVRWFYMFVIFIMFAVWILPQRNRTEAEYLKWTEKQTESGSPLVGFKRITTQWGTLSVLIVLIGSPLVAWFTEPFTTNSYIAIGSCLSLILIDSLFQRFVCPTPAHEKKK